jgi:hypothetical protein
MHNDRDILCVLQVRRGIGVARGVSHYVPGSEGLLLSDIVVLVVCGSGRFVVKSNVEDERCWPAECVAGGGCGGTACKESSLERWHVQTVVCLSLSADNGGAAEAHCMLVLWRHCLQREIAGTSSWAVVFVKGRTVVNYGLRRGSTALGFNEQASRRATRWKTGCER